MSRFSLVLAETSDLDGEQKRGCRVRGVLRSFGNAIENQLLKILVKSNRKFEQSFSKMFEITPFAQLTTESFNNKLRPKEDSLRGMCNFG